VAIANAEATVSLSGATEIDAASLWLNANAHSEAVVTSVGVGLAVAYGESNPTAKVTVGDGVHLFTSGDLTVTTVAESRVDVEATQSILGPNKPASAYDVTLAVGVATIESTAWLQSGAVLNVGGDLTVDASMSKQHEVKASAGAYEDGSVGGAIALSGAGSAVNALLDASADVGGGVEVQADATVSSNDTAATAQVGTGALAKPVIAAKSAVGLANATGSFFQQVAPPPDQRSQGPTNFALSAAFAYANHSNLALARIDAGAQVGAHAGDIDVKATIVDAPEISARAFIDSQKISENNPAGNTKENSLSAAVVLGYYGNEADAHIGAGAAVNASGAVAVQSQTSIPLVIDWLHIAEHPSPSDVGSTLCIDEAFPGFNREGRGQRLFGEDKKPSAYVSSVLKFLEQYQVEFRRTQAFCEKLKALKLLEPMRAQANLKSGEQLALTGFMAVSRERLKALPAEKLAELARTDELELLYLHLHSMRNFAAMVERVG